MIFISFIPSIDSLLKFQMHLSYIGITPYFFQLEAGKEYRWCTCGQSAKQPLCDGAHRGSGFVPLRFKAEKTETALMCRCKNTSNPPYCDMSHFKVGVFLYINSCFLGIIVSLKYCYLEIIISLKLLFP